MNSNLVQEAIEVVAPIAFPGSGGFWGGHAPESFTWWNEYGLWIAVVTTVILQISLVSIRVWKADMSGRKGSRRPWIVDLSPRVPGIVAGLFFLIFLRQVYEAVVYLNACGGGDVPLLLNWSVSIWENVWAGGLLVAVLVLLSWSGDMIERYRSRANSATPLDTSAK